MKNELLRADLHIHSIYSDGSDNPWQICQKAAESGVLALAITDHDGLGNVQEKRAAARQHNLMYVDGIEFSTYLDNAPVHILGYGINVDDKEFLNILQKLDSDRLQRTIIMLDRLKAYYNIDISLKECRQTSTQSVGSMHIARAIVKRGFAQSTKQAFMRFIGSGTKAFCPELRQTPAWATQTITKYGGKAVLAHPGLLKTDAEQTVKSLLDFGLCGIEAHYSSHTKTQTEFFLNLSKHFNLVTTAGSDYHGYGRAEQIGTPQVYLPLQLLKLFNAI